MKIGIIGMGNIGSTIARKLQAEGHEIRLANSRGPEGVRSVADHIGAKAVDVDDAVKGADAIILAIPLPAMARLPKGVLDAVPADVPVVDTSNYYPGLRDPQIPEIETGCRKVSGCRSNSAVQSSKPSITSKMGSSRVSGRAFIEASHNRRMIKSSADCTC